MKSARRQNRMEALQILFQLDLNQELSTQKALKHFEEFYSLDKKQIDDFTRRLVIGVTDNLKNIDSILKNASENWRPNRMAAVDRNALRLGVFELLHCNDIPATVSINEMIEVAKQFGSESSPSFINGILDKIRQLYPNPDKAK
ncbi:MAG: transcription antitermination factor NusB [Bdellovibrionales bacterium]|nr:transcription antitermination factor NusB [Pseudomonadota bacterium]MSP19851.1 transcription antitermination factor NusB [Bdellovibrionales bacterium]